MKALIIGTGPSLRHVTHLIPHFRGILFVCNNTWAEPWVREQYERSGNRPCWLACDPSWHQFFGKVDCDWIDRWHWSEEICSAHGYRHVSGVWHEGKNGPTRLWLKDSGAITLGHCSGVQLLNLAANQYACSEIALIGHDFRYPKSQPRHYFSGLSETEGEYPRAIRKFSQFDKGANQYDLMDVYAELAQTEGIPPVFNSTQGSALTAFPHRPLEDFLCSTDTKI